MDNNNLSEYDKNRDRIINYQVNRYANDEGFKNMRKMYSRAYSEFRYKNDPEFREAKREKNREYQRKLREARDTLLKLKITTTN